MQFTLKKPCKDCPFLRTENMFASLTKDRMLDITHAITNENKTFTCHKTLNMPKMEQQHCAGALLYQRYHAAHKRQNDMLQIAERLGIYDPTTVNDCDNIITPEDIENKPY